MVKIKKKDYKPPNVVFIIPYRNRESHLNCFVNHMSYILEDVQYNYEIIVCHQNDTRRFNRGAMKNLGFIYVKNKYPNDYKDITFVFNDVDTMPGKKNMFDYITHRNTVKHFYGFTFALGGIFSITGEDFEKIDGFPNYWTWGFEDNALYNRCIKNNIIIDREQFYNYDDLDILQFFNGIDRNTNAKTYEKFILHKNKKINFVEENNGITTISNVNYKDVTVTQKNILYKIIHFEKWEIPESKNINEKSMKDIYKNKNKKTTKLFLM